MMDNPFHSYIQDYAAQLNPFNSTFGGGLNSLVDMDRAFKTGPLAGMNHTWNALNWKLPEVPAIGAPYGFGRASGSHPVGMLGNGGLPMNTGSSL